MKTKRKVRSDAIEECFFQLVTKSNSNNFFQVPRRQIFTYLPYEVQRNADRWKSFSKMLTELWRASWVSFLGGHDGVCLSFIYALLYVPRVYWLIERFKGLTHTFLVFRPLACNMYFHSTTSADLSQLIPSSASKIYVVTTMLPVGIQLTICCPRTCAVHLFWSKVQEHFLKLNCIRISGVDKDW